MISTWFYPCITGKDETDFVVLRHEVGVTWSDGRKERRDITMTVRGDSASHTAMARTVGLPTAIAAKMVLDGNYTPQTILLLRSGAVNYV